MCILKILISGILTLCDEAKHQHPKKDKHKGVFISVLLLTVSTIYEHPVISTFLLTLLIYNYLGMEFCSFLWKVTSVPAFLMGQGKVIFKLGFGEIKFGF